MPSVRVIPASAPVRSAQERDTTVKRRVAFYARVSTDSDEQKNSYDAQVDYYSRYIKEHPEWQYQGGYTDEGISAVNTNKRDGFKQMVADGLAGKFDLLITKSVSRFARNTVDSLTAVRKLKEVGCEIWFEEQNIFTLDSKGELLITIMSSLAQEESRSISENVTWGQRKRFADGKFNLAYSQFLGYEKGDEGVLKIVPEEAETVRLIYQLFLEGKTPAGICSYLGERSIPTPTGKQKWNQNTVKSILMNEKYKGDALLQKKFTVDFLTKKLKINEGEVQQYYVENSHPAIIQPDDWERVQTEIARRQALGHAYSGSVFVSKLICSDCGRFYGAKVWHSTDKYREVVWTCNNKYGSKNKCQTPHLRQKDIENKFLTAYGLLLKERDHIIADGEALLSIVDGSALLDEDIIKIKDEIEILAGLVRKCVEDNAASAKSQEEYQKHYAGLVKRYDRAVNKRESLLAERKRRADRDTELRLFIDSIRSQPLVLDKWDEHVWVTLVESGTVQRDGSITFKFVNGTEINV